MEDGLETFLEESDANPSLFLIKSRQADCTEILKGTLGLYVDDFLVAGKLSTVQVAMESIMREWKTSEPEFVGPNFEGKMLTFLGIQIQYADGAYCLTQDFKKISSKISEATRLSS